VGTCPKTQERYGSAALPMSKMTQGASAKKIMTNSKSAKKEICFKILLISRLRDKDKP
jgi:hypothetical protein